MSTEPPTYPGQPQPSWGQPQQRRPVPVKRSWYKKKRFVIPLGVLGFLVILGIFAPDPEQVAVVADPPTAASEPAVTTAVKKPVEASEPAVTTNSVKKPTAARATTVAPTTKAPRPKPKKTVTLTSGQKNALGKAEDYLEHQAFSRKGLIAQLKFEQFTISEATYAVDHVPVNWKSQAAKKAEQYLSNQSFSRSGLIQQLKFEGFTSAQAKHGVAVAY